MKYQYKSTGLAHHTQRQRVSGTIILIGFKYTTVLNLIGEFSTHSQPAGCEHICVRSSAASEPTTPSPTANAPNDMHRTQLACAPGARARSLSNRYHLPATSELNCSQFILPVVGSDVTETCASAATTTRFALALGRRRRC